MREAIQDGKFVELAYKVTDRKSGRVLSGVELPLSYIQRPHDVLAPSVATELQGRFAGDVIEVPIDGKRMFGGRDESLVFTDRLENVPLEYRKVGRSILMQNDRGESRSFTVTHVDSETVTVDGNHPLCDIEAIFTLEILSVRDATDDEMKAGGAVGNAPNVDPSTMVAL